MKIRLNALLFISSIGLLSLTACKKNYSCKCSYEMQMINPLTFEWEYQPQTIESNSVKLTKKQSNTVCDDLKKELNDGAPIIRNVSCNAELK